MSGATQGEDASIGLTPEQYLAQGFFDGRGRPRAELRTEWATAACAQLLAAEVPAQELSMVAETLRQLLPVHDEREANARLVAALEEALMVVARAFQQSNNGGMVDWLSGCAAAVRTEADLGAFITHLQSVDRQYVLFAAMQPVDPLSSGPSA